MSIASVDGAPDPAEGLSSRDLARKEKEIAASFIGGVPWIMVVWGLGNFALWVALWPLTIYGVIPLWLGFVIATISASYAYLPSHEAQHSNIAQSGSRLFWLNELVGYVSPIPIGLPYKLAKATHMKHHTYTNDPQRDPDIHNKANNLWGAIKNGIEARRPGAITGLHPSHIENDVGSGPIIFEAYIFTRIYWAAMALLAWSGFAIEALVLWWLPSVIAISYIQITLSWAPHFPMEETGRYKDTRAWKSPVGTILSAGMEYHIIHHLHPAIPLQKTGAAYRALRPLLVTRGCRIDGL